MAELEYLRDFGLPTRLANLKRVEVLLANWSARSVENAAGARRLLRRGELPEGTRWPARGLLSPELFAAKVAAETEFQSPLDESDRICRGAGGLRQDCRGDADHGGAGDASWFARRAQAFNCDSFGLARTLLRAGDEQSKPNGERLREFSDSGKQSLELALFSEKPIYADLEIVLLADALTHLAGEAGRS